MKTPVFKNSSVSVFLLKPITINYREIKAKVDVQEKMGA